MDYVTVADNGRLTALRRVLDVLNPASALIFVRDRDRVNEVNDLLRAIGYGGDDSVRVGLAASPGTELVLLYDLPASREEWHEAAGAATRAVALVQPRQLASLRTLASGGSVKPLTLPESGQRARAHDERLRGELRGILDGSAFGRELLAVEPLLEFYDGAEIAPRRLQLLEREREAHKATAAARSSTSARRDPGDMVRLFVTVGSRDGARPADLVARWRIRAASAAPSSARSTCANRTRSSRVSASVADTLIEK